MAIFLKTIYICIIYFNYDIPVKFMKKFYYLGKKSLFRLNRSITGRGTLRTLKIIKNEFPNLKIIKIKSGKKVFDWTVPNEWNVSEAFVLDKNNKIIIDFKKNNLHLLGYSIPVNKYINKRYLLKKLYYQKNLPNAIPYLTSYYKKRWGFCVSFNDYKKINKKYKNDDKFKVVIKSNFNKRGNLNYGELILKGKSSQEILVSTYICHPSMANNELSGPLVSMGLINYFKKINLNKTLRFVFIPETIGSISYLNRNIKKLRENVIGGYNLSCIGDDRMHSCMLSKIKISPSDEAILEAYKKLNIKKFTVYSFIKDRGSDEAQYNYPGVDIPITSIFRTKYGKFREYHTSLDDFKLVTIKGLFGGFKVAREAIKILQRKVVPKNKILCEPNMGKRGLYPTLSNGRISKSIRDKMNFLQYADGKHSTDLISKKINLSLSKVNKIYRNLKKHDLII